MKRNSNGAGRRLVAKLATILLAVSGGGKRHGAVVGAFVAGACFTGVIMLGAAYLGGVKLLALVSFSFASGLLIEGPTREGKEETGAGVVAMMDGIGFSSIIAMAGSILWWIFF